MKKTISIIQRVSAAVLVVVSLASPVVVMAATDSDNTTINATIASVISIATSGTVAINVTPVSGGSQTSY